MVATSDTSTLGGLSSWVVEGLEFTAVFIKLRGKTSSEIIDPI